MIWDVRVWSFFIWLVGTGFFLSGFATPYSMPGNRIKIQLGFGGDVLPGGVRVGLWSNVPSELSGAVMAVKGLLCVGAAMILVSLVGYIILFRRHNNIASVVTFVSQILAGVFCLIGIGVFRASSSALGEGFWFVTMAACLFILNAVVLIFMPYMEFQQPKWKTELHGQEESVPLARKPEHV